MFRKQIHLTTEFHRVNFTQSFTEVNFSESFTEVNLGSIESEKLISSYELHDIFGKCLMKNEFMINSPIDLSPLSAGMYFVTVFESDGIAHFKIIKE